ncbi:MAG: hypothetical protein VR64_07670 [Desulfatitalea sp. BRH_c12]|nr:MAG: hypothetical protein VR64_07670 [Desulfatitalea sp. BRH_c12]
MRNLIPWRKQRNQEVTEFRREFDNLMDRFFGEDFFPSTEFMREGRWAPSLDISEGKKDITIRAEIPGVDHKDLDISLEGRMLSIKGEKKQEKEEKDENQHRVERSYGYFARTVQLPTEVDPDKVEAEYKQGVLTVRLKKTRESEKKRIEIKTG